MSWLIGNAGYAFFDYWFMAHLSFWFVIGSTAAAMQLKRGLAFACCLSAAYSWEIFERFAEKKWPLVWQSPESWWNAWISDPLTVCISLTVAFFGYDYLRKFNK